MFSPKIYKGTPPQRSIAKFLIDLRNMYRRIPLKIPRECRKEYLIDIPTNKDWWNLGENFESIPEINIDSIP